MRRALLQLFAATALANKIMRSITIHKTARSAARSPINQPSKNDKYVVTANTTRVVVLKVPHSGSTWFAALLNRFPRSYVKEESITKTTSNNVDPSAIHEHVGTSLIRPTDKMVASRNGKHAFSPRAKNFDCGGCELALLGLTMCPMRSEPPYDFPRGVPAAIFHQTVKFKAIFWARTNVVKMSFAFATCVSRHLRVKGARRWRRGCFPSPRWLHALVRSRGPRRPETVPASQVERLQESNEGLREGKALLRYVCKNPGLQNRTTAVARCAL